MFALVQVALVQPEETNSGQAESLVRTAKTAGPIAAGLRRSASHRAGERRLHRDKFGGLRNGLDIQTDDPASEWTVVTHNF